MTDEQIDNLQPGRELDRLIAQHVFGLTPLTELECNIILEWEARRGSGGIPSVDGLFRDDQNQIRWIGRYSTEIRDAWEIVEKMGKDGYQMNHYFRTGNGFLIQDHSINFWKIDTQEELTSADSFPLAICRCALKMTMKRNHEKV